MKIHIWVPNYSSGTGGIQNLSRFVVRGLRDLFPEAHITVLAKNDTCYPEVSDIRVDSFYLAGTWSPRLRTVAFARQVIVQMLRQQPDLIFIMHANFTSVWLLCRRFVSAKVFAVGAGIDVWNIRNRGLKRALRKVHRLLAISDFTRQKMAYQLGVVASSIGFLFPTFDSKNFKLNDKPRFLLKRYRLAASTRVIFTLARLEKSEQYKGYDQLIRALPEIRKHFPEVRYILGGSGSDRQRIEELVRKLDLGEIVILPGRIPEYEICSHYNFCDIFAMPSKGEGFGIVFLEALACGKPVIAGNKDGSVDALLNGKLGVLVDPDNVAQIAEAIITLLAKSTGQGAQSKEERAESAEQLRREVIEAYGYQRFKERLAEVVKPLIAEQRGRGEG